MPIRFAEYAYSDNHQQLSVKDANDNLTAYGYDGQDRLTFTAFPSPTSGTPCSPPTFALGLPQNCTTGQTYEAQWYTVDGTPTGTRCNGSDAPCRKRNRAGDIIAFSYDALNRQTTKTVPSLPTITTAYNLLSEPTLISNPVLGTFPAHSIEYSYDAAGRKLFEKNDGKQVSYQYDQAGNRSRTTWPDGYYVSYLYDAPNRMTKVRENSTTANELASYSYDQLSRRTLLQLGGLATNTVTYAYEADSDLDLLTHKLNATTMTLDYGRNHSHQITGLTANDDFYLGPNVPLVSLTSYAVNRLNQYTSLTLRPMSYDGNGNLTSWAPVLLNRHTYTFDAENRLRSAATNGALVPSIFYDYDPLGRRISKTVSGTSTVYLLDGDEEIAEYDAFGIMLRRYITGPAIDDRIAAVELTTMTPTKTFYHVNHQGSVLAMTDAAGNAPTATTNPCAMGTNCQRLSYDEYGLLSQGSVATGQPYRFTGRRFDIETGLYYYRARYYSPDLGRFLSIDPVGYKDDINLYSYVRNDPANSIDPTGETCDKASGGGLVCKVDQIVDAKGKSIDRSDLSKSQQKQLAAFEKSYTVAVNKLSSTPNRSAAVQVPVFGPNGKVSGQFRSAIFSAGNIAKSLSDRTVVFSTDKDGGKGLASTFGPTVIFKNGITGEAVNALTGGNNDLARQIIITHEGMHGTDDEARFSPSGLMAGQLNNAHQTPYNDAAQNLLNIGAPQ